jgi:glycosyltransferase involved in cell wall biosynthesis
LQVVHVINNLVVGGAERFLVQLVRAQTKLGWDPAVATLVQPNPLAGELERLGIPHWSCGRSRLNDPRLVLDLRAVLRRHHPDVVHTHLFYADAFGRVAARLAGVPAIVTTEHSTEGGLLSRRRLAGMRATAGLADRIVAVSEPVRQSAALRLGVPVERIDVIPNGIDLEAWAGFEARARAARAATGRDVVVGCVGRLVEAKGYDLLLEALAQLEPPRPRLVVAGDGPDRAELEARAARLGIAADVEWLGFRPDVPALLASFDVFAMPSRWEGHSVALLEAMAAGCACLGSDIPEIVETLGDAGLCVEAGSVAALAAGLRQLAASPERRAELGRAAEHRVRRFSIDSAAQRYADVYAAALATHGAVGGTS